MVSYENELLGMEPKMRSMVRNFRQYGYRYDDQDDNDLLQELFVKGLESKDQYNPARSAIKTFLYSRFKWKMMKMAGKNDRVMFLAAHIDDVDMQIMPPLFCCKNTWRKGVQSSVHSAVRDLEALDKQLSSVCHALIEFSGIKKKACDSLGMSGFMMERSLSKIRASHVFSNVMNFIPF